MSGPPLDVLVLARVADRHLEQIRAVDPRVRVAATADRDSAQALAQDAQVIVGWHIPESVMERATRLKWIHVMAMILAFSRRLHIAVRNQMARRWDRATTLGEELEGKVLGVLGVGAIGRVLAARAAAFGMRVIGTKRTPEPVPHVERVVPPEETDTVLREADFLAVILPLPPQTRGLIDARALTLMKPSAVIINVGRGAVVQEAALIDALRTGTIAGAALDVFEREPLSADSPLYGMENVIITPHVSGASPTYFDRAIPLFCENLRRYLAGAPLLNVVDPARGY